LNLSNQLIETFCEIDLDEIDGGAAEARLFVERVVRRHEVRHVRDVHANLHLFRDQTYN